MIEQSDEELIEQLKSGQKEALSMLFERYKNRILNFCIRIIGNRADAEDITADVFLILANNNASYTLTPTAKFSTWIYTIARNACIDRLRHKKKFVSMWFSSKESDDTDSWDIPDSNPSHREELIQKDMAHRVRKAVALLPLDQREAIVLREYQNLSYEEISVVLGCSLEKTKILIFRSRETLRLKLTSTLQEGRNE